MTAAVRRQHHLPGQPSEQHRPRDRPFRPEAGPAYLRQCISTMQPSTVQFPRTSGSANVWPWPVRYSIFHCDEGIALHSFQQPRRTVYTIRYTFKGNNCMKRILCSLAQLYTFVGVVWTALMFATVTGDYDHVLCASIQTLSCLPLCTTTYSTDALQDSVSADAEAK